MNQFDQAEVVGIVKSIPAIYGNAVKTLAVKGADGVYQCCAEAFECLPKETDFFELSKFWDDHFDEQHPQNQPFEESYLHRVWTYSEITLSHTVQFELCTLSTSSYKITHTTL